MEIRKLRVIAIAIAASFVIIGCGNVNVTINSPNEQSEIEYSDDVCPLERNGIELYLSRLSMKDTQPEKSILLVHGVTYRIPALTAAEEMCALMVQNFWSTLIRLRSPRW